MGGVCLSKKPRAKQQNRHVIDLADNREEKIRNQIDGRDEVDDGHNKNQFTGERHARIFEEAADQTDELGQVPKQFPEGGLAQGLGVREATGHGEVNQIITFCLRLEEAKKFTDKFNNFGVGKNDQNG